MYHFKVPFYRHRSMVESLRGKMANFLKITFSKKLTRWKYQQVFLSFYVLDVF